MRMRAVGIKVQDEVESKITSGELKTVDINVNEYLMEIRALIKECFQKTAPDNKLTEGKTGLQILEVSKRNTCLTSLEHRITCAEEDLAPA